MSPASAPKYEPERDRLAPVEVGRRRDHDPAHGVLAHEEQVDDPQGPLALEPLELGQDLAPEVVPLEGDAEHLNRPDRLDGVSSRLGVHGLRLAHSS